MQAYTATSIICANVILVCVNPDEMALVIPPKNPENVIKAVFGIECFLIYDAKVSEIELWLLSAVGYGEYCK